MTSIAQKTQQKEILLMANTAQDQGVQGNKEEGDQLVFRNIDATSDIWCVIRSIGHFAQFLQNPVEH